MFVELLLPARNHLTRHLLTLIPRRLRHSKVLIVGCTGLSAEVSFSL